MSYIDEIIGKYVIVRTRYAGVFAGILSAKNGNEVAMTDARRIWYWAGAATLSQLAIDGTSKPDECKFPAPVPMIILEDVIEIISTTSTAESSIREVAVWRA